MSLNYVVVRLAQIVPTFFLIMVVIFVLVRLLPGDPTSAVLGIHATDEAVERINAELGLDRSIPVQFGLFFEHFLSGDLGDSIILKVPVMRLILERLPVTLFLTGFAALMAVILAVPMALVSAIRRDSLLDNAIRAGFQVGLSMPVFYIGILLLTFLAAKLRWFPVGGFGNSFTRQPVSSVPAGADLGAQPVGGADAQPAQQHHRRAGCGVCGFRARQGPA